MFFAKMGLTRAIIDGILGRMEARIFGRDVWITCMDCIQTRNRGLAMETIEGEIEVLKHNIAVRLDDYIASIRLWRDENYRHKEIVYRLTCAVASIFMDEINIRYPTTWWDGFKEQYFPAWFRKRFPVRYTEHNYSVKEYFPKMPIRDDQAKVYFVRLQTPLLAYQEKEIKKGEAN
ncbi:hypothetical protein ALO_12561 [Acetonema longum DSM 6540]|uniref:Uncharacterized protein n=2 Tax=Acetonema TaxID=2373 RepID=F7NK99_9FIRM|nr:hypothetical protein ALO_12561 [Acetonema longum DSM 6540]